MTRQLDKEIIKDTHELNIASAAISYVNLPTLSIVELAKSFKVSIAKISEWLTEAAKKGYVDDISRLKEKHLKEYERINGFYSTTLEQEYKLALAIY